MQPSTALQSGADDHDPEERDDRLLARVELRGQEVEEADVQPWPELPQGRLEIAAAAESVNLLGDDQHEQARNAGRHVGTRQAEPALTGRLDHPDHGDRGDHQLDRVDVDAGEARPGAEASEERDLLGKRLGQSAELELLDQYRRSRHQDDRPCREPPAQERQRESKYGCKYRQLPGELQVSDREAGDDGKGNRPAAEECQAEAAARLELVDPWRGVNRSRPGR